LAETGAVRHIERATLLRLAGRDGMKKAPSVAASVRHLVSSDVRAALRRDPLLAKLDQAARTAVTKLGRRMETKLRLGIEGPTPVPRPDPYANIAVGLCAQQLRDVWHRSDRAERLLGYKAPVSFSQSIAHFGMWYHRMHGMDTPFWSLSRHLYGS